ncbi:hypothetical protein [Schleiferilactobacillus shenzhenensis]|uniref:Uncharacterized protein n=1 Tax=Schleiferilactobacillus shenzhenensis LY-73 TaxID=1231336 RepID=U4TTF2_9LACO|nr:hypothetical protein [Schleiferilactobacillus shenzhenensis]ERL65163.1 hypothetical protein L248_3101 [Schleiferilactobacillus shenzhenensis LY-73]
MTIQQEPNGVLYTYLYPKNFTATLQANAARAELQRRADLGDAQAAFFLRAQSPATFLNGTADSEESSEAPAAQKPAKEKKKADKKAEKKKDKDKSGKKDKKKKKHKKK